MKGYIEWVTEDPDVRIGFITNTFNRILYVCKDWPNGDYEKWTDTNTIFDKKYKMNCKRGRSFTKEELVLELL